MKLESQVCTLEQAKKLKELGVKQEGVYYWYDGSTAINEPILLMRTDMKIAEGDMCYSAFTVAELGVMLPHLTNNLIRLGYSFDNIWGWTSFIHTFFGIKKPVILNGNFETEAEARAAMLIHLIESKLITVEKINPRS